MVPEGTFFDGIVVLLATLLLYGIVQLIGIALGRLLHWPGDHPKHDDRDA